MAVADQPGQVLSGCRPAMALPRPPGAGFCSWGPVSSRGTGPAYSQTRCCERPIRPLPASELRARSSATTKVASGRVLALPCQRTTWTLSRRDPRIIRASAQSGLSRCAQSGPANLRLCIRVDPPHGGPVLPAVRGAGALCPCRQRWHPEDAGGCRRAVRA
jgi:hypothetical protein